MIHNVYQAVGEIIHFRTVHYSQRLITKHRMNLNCLFIKSCGIGFAVIAAYIPSLFLISFIFLLHFKSSMKKEATPPGISDEKTTNDLI